MRLPHITFGKVLAGTAVLLVVTSGTAYAAATIGSDDIIDGSIKSVDIKDEQVSSVDILNGNVKSPDIKDGDVRTVDILDETITGADVANESLTNADLGTDSVQATEVADNSIDAGEIVDFGLSNQDVGVLFAQINADGTVANSSGGVSAFAFGGGQYEVDFGVNISFCAFTATEGGAGVGDFSGGIMAVTDRSNNAEAVFVQVRNTAGAVANLPFQLIVVC